MFVNESAKKIINILVNHGYEAVLAGGCVRDGILGIEPNDWDIATSATPDQIEKLFSHSIPIGKAFGIITVIMNSESFEIATFRNDGNYSDGRRPDSIQFTTMEEDAKRRDLTINGMFYDVINDKVIDYVGGMKDLQDRVIRFIGNPLDRIQEDHLRIMRAIRFAVRYGFSLDKETKDIIHNNSSLLTKISIERIREELEKMFISKNMRQVLTLLSETQILAYTLPEINNLKSCDQNPLYHPEGNTWEHTLQVLDVLPNTASQVEVWATLFHDIGKAYCTEEVEGKIVSPRHESIGEEYTREILTRLKFSNTFIEAVCFIVGNHMKIKYAPEMKISKIKKILAHPYSEVLINVSYADSKSGGRDVAWYDYIQKNIEEWKRQILLPKPFIGGKDLITLGMKPGKQFGIILDQIYDEQLEGIVTDRDKGLSRLNELVSQLE